MTTKVKRVKLEELRVIAAGVVVPPNATDVVMAVEHTPGGTLPNGTPNGLGGKTRYGPAFFIGGLRPGEPIALFSTQAEARELLALIAGPEGELWQRKEARRRRIAELEEIERANEAEAAEAAKEKAKTERRLRRAGVDIAEATGGGSSRRSTSSSRRTGTTGKPRAARRKR